MSNRRAGLHSLAYTGVAATDPPQLVIQNRVPTADDYAEWVVGTLWIYDTEPQQLWMLMNKRAHVATWMLLAAGGGGILALQEGDNINIDDPNGPVATINLNTSIFQPVTSADGLEGLYALGGNDFLHAYGTQNTFLGESAGNRTLTVFAATENTGIGFQALAQLTLGELNTAVGDTALGNLTDGESNTAIGHDSADAVTTGDFNTALGGHTLGQLLTGSYNTALGYRAGFAYTGVESDNIVIGGEGVVGDAHTIRIGAQGALAGQQDTAYIAGIFGSAPGAINGIVTVDDDGRMAYTTGNNGALLIGSTGGSPVWAALASSDGSIAITNTANHIDLVAIGGGGGGGATTFITDVNSPAVIDGGNITMAGAGVLQTDGGGGSHTVTLRLVNGADGQVLIGGGAAPAWAGITSLGGSVTVTPGANTINLEVVGAGGGANTFTTDAGDAVSVAGVINVLGGDNINTVGAGLTVTVNLDESIVLPNTNAAGTQGLYTLGASPFLHNYGTWNTFAGGFAGNRALTVGAATDNTAFGSYALSLVTTGSGNTATGSDSLRQATMGTANVASGYQALFNVTEGIGNTGVGYQSVNAVTTGSRNTALGYRAGANYTVNDSSNISIGHVGASGISNRINIGTQGAGAGQQNTAYVAGIYGSAPGAINNLVFVDNTGKLGVIAGGDGQILVGSAGGSPVWTNLTSADGTVVITNGPGTVDLSTLGGGGGDVTGVNGGININVDAPGGPVPTVNLDDVVVLTAAGSLSVGSAKLHNRGGSVFLGLNGGANCVADTNVGIGHHAMLAVTTGTHNVGVGSNALRSITVGSDNIAVGSGHYLDYWGGAGSNRNVIVGVRAFNRSSQGNDNIMIGYSAGAPQQETIYGYADSAISIGNTRRASSSSHTIRIGTQGSGAAQQDTAYIAGIFGSIPGQTAEPVYVDEDGKLGTMAGYATAFLGIQAGTAQNVTGDGSIYYLGVAQRVGEVYDAGGNYDPGGDGNPATFTAPIDGLYFLEVQFLVTGLVAPVAPVQPVSDPAIVTTRRTYKLINSIFQAQANGQQSYFYNVVADMIAGDTARYYIEITFGDGTKTLSIAPNQTFISGYIIRAGAV